MSREHLERLAETLARLERDSDAREAALRTRALGVGTLIRTLAAVVGLLALANLYFVNDLTQEVRLTTLAMQEMTGHFAQVAERMNGMTRSVEAMDRDVALMPVVRDQMGQLGGQVEDLGRDVAGLARSTASLDARMDALNAGVFDMAQRFRGLNRSVAGMGADVDQMAKPIP